MQICTHISTIIKGTVRAAEAATTGQARERKSEGLFLKIDLLKDKT